MAEQKPFFCLDCNKEIATEGLCEKCDVLFKEMARKKGFYVKKLTKKEIDGQPIIYTPPRSPTDTDDDIPF